MLRLALASALLLACVTVTRIIRWAFDLKPSQAIDLSVMFLIAATTCAYGFDNGQWNGIDPKVRDWFKSIRSPHGVPCCDIADGHRTTWNASTEGGTAHYIVPIEGFGWVAVPPEAVVYGSGNPTGEAIVWYVMVYPQNSGPVPFIRCFVPGGGA